MQEVLSEVYSVVNAMGEEYKARIPLDVWNVIEEKRDKNYTPIVDENKALNEQGLSIDTITFIAMLHRDYWCDSDEERAELISLFDANEQKLRERLNAAENTRNLMKLIKEKK